MEQKFKLSTIQVGPFSLYFDISYFDMQLNDDLLQGYIVRNSNI